MFRKIFTVSFIFFASFLYSESRGLEMSGDMVVEFSNTFGADFETGQTGFSNNLYVYLAANLLSWDYFVKNEGSVKPAGYVIINGANLGFMKKHETFSSNSTAPDGVDGSKDNHSVSWGSVNADSGWDRLEAGISMYPFFIEFFDEYGAPAANFDWAGLESTMDRKVFEYDHLKPYGSDKESKVKAVYEHTGGMELGYLSRKADLSLTVSSRYDHNYVPDVEDEDTVDDYRNNYSFGGSFNLKKKFFGGLPFNLQGGVSGSNFSEKQDFSFGGKLKYNFKNRQKKYTVSPFIAGDVLLSIEDEEESFAYEIASGVAILLDEKEEWKYNRAKYGEYKYSSGNTNTTHWRRWHDSGNGADGYPGMAFAARYVDMGDEEESSVDLLFQAWEFDGNEGVNENLGVSFQLNVEDITSTADPDQLDILGRLYIEYELADDIFRPYIWIDGSKDPDSDLSLSFASGLGWKAFKNGFIDFRYETPSLIGSDTEDMDPGQFLMVTTITY